MTLPFPLADDGLDQQLRDVKLPEGLIERLQQTVQWTDEELDAALIDVPTPPAIIARLSRTGPPNHTQRRLQRMALAASLLLAVGLSLGGAWVIYEASGSRLAREAQPGWLETFLPGDEAQITVGTAANPTADAAAGQLVDGPLFLGPRAPEIELTDVEPVAPIPVFPSPFPNVERRDHAPGRTAELNLKRFGADVLGSSHVDAEMPEWRMLPGLVPRGVKPPDSPAFDLTFLHSTRFHPVVAPRLDKELATSRLPLGTSRESFLLARRLLAEGELPSPEMPRTEEFLAAVDYEFPSSRERVALHAAAGFSPLGGPQLRLLQVGVRAGEVAPPRRGPAHLILCIDVSASMQRGARLEQTQQALRELIKSLLPTDSVSLVAFDREPRLLVEQARSENAAALLAAIDSLQTAVGSDPVAALRLAYGLASENAATKQTQQVLLFTDGLIKVEPLATSSLETYLRASAGRLARLWLVDLSQNQVSPEHWLQVAQATEGRLTRAATADEMRWTLLEALTGKSQQVAADTALSVSFNPQSVAGYRLLGHEATLLPAEPQTELFSGQTSVGLYELQLLPKGPDLVATVTLSWRDPASGQRRNKQQLITRGSFAKSFSTEPASLQLATLAAETAEYLRRSPYREVSTSRPLRELAGQVSPAVMESPSYKELMNLVNQAEKAHPAPDRVRQIWSRGPK